MCGEARRGCMGFGGPRLWLFRDGDFLHFGWLLAADAVAGFERLDVADLAEVAHPEELAVAHGEEVVHLECAVGLPLAFHTDFAVRKALVLKGVKEPGGSSAEVEVPSFDSQDGSCAWELNQLAFQRKLRIRGGGLSEDRACEQDERHRPRECEHVAGFDRGSHEKRHRTTGASLKTVAVAAVSPPSCYVGSETAVTAVSATRLPISRPR